MKANGEVVDDVNRPGAGRHSVLVRHGLVVGSLAGISVLLLVVSLLARLADLQIGRLDVDVENSLPTLWSVQMLALMTILITIRALIGIQLGEPSWAWLVTILAAGFITIDEGLAIHEELIEPVRTALDTGGLLYQAWMIPYAGLVGIGVVALSPLIRSIETDLRDRVFAAAAVFLLGAFGMEAIGGSVIDSGDFESVSYSVIVTLEEGFEMVGVIMAVSALIRSISRHGGFVLQLDP